MKKLMFAVIDNGMGLSSTKWAVSFAGALLYLRNVEIALFHCSYPYPDGAMNMVTAEFMESDCHELVTIDTDLEFQPHDLLNLISHEVPYVAGRYPQKVRELTYPLGTLTEANPFTDAEKLKANPLVEVAWVTRGFSKIHRAVFEAMAQPCNDLRWWDHPSTGRSHPEWWRNEVGGHNEDKNFCERYRSLGGRVLVDSRIIVRHEGRASYPL
jgi:hypothetical protein